MSLKLASSAFQPQGAIPPRHSKDGGNVSPTLSWSGVPKEARSLALIVDDPDAPSGVFVHWLLYGIPISTNGLAEGQPATEIPSDGMRQGRNGFGELGYGGPQPPNGTHRYIFHLFALDSELDLPPGASRHQLDQALKGHVIGEAQLVGTYEHRKEGSHAA
jgi:hypothetical protein